MASLLFYLSASVLFAQSTFAFNCSQPPIYVDIHKRAVHGTDVFQYGSFIGVGNPAQNQSLWPSLRQNQTSVASIHYCDNSNLTNCAQSTRGNFDPSLSNTFIQDPRYTSLDSNTTSIFNSSYGEDTIHLYTHFFETDAAFQNVINNYTLEVANAGSVSPGIVGMGLSSTLLQELFDNNMIAGRTYSLYIGSGMDRAGGVINGSNTFGGYDAGRFTNPVHRYAMNISDSNPLSVTVTDIILDSSDSSSSIQNISLFSPSAFPTLKSAPPPFEAKITTDQYPLSLPHALTQNFISLLSATPSTSPDASLALTKPFNGTLTLVLSDGFRVTLPPDVLVNASSLTPIAASPSNADGDGDGNADGPFYLGAAFLTQLYLMADFDSYQFFLAPAIQQQLAVMPVSFCPKATPAPYAPPRQTGFVQKGLIGAVLGGVVGGMAVVTFLGCVAVGWRRGGAAREMRRAERRLEREGKAVEGVGMERFEVED
ncbi:acid protease, partial [Glonium stellatum]